MAFVGLIIRGAIAIGAASFRVAGSLASATGRGISGLARMGRGRSGGGGGGTFHIEVKGLRELQRDFRRLEADARKLEREELARAAEPVAEEVRQRLGRFRGARINTVAPMVVRGSVVVRQRARKVTGTKPDFGMVQMVHAFEPALDAKRDAVIVALEDALDGMIRRHNL